MMCSGFILIYEQFIQYKFYKLAVRLDNLDIQQNWVGDVKFEVNIIYDNATM
jgi:hypothetical protein